MWYTGTPLWPFGWGLSYTTFSYNWLNSTVMHLNTGGWEMRLRGRHVYVCYCDADSFSVASIASKVQQLEYAVNVTNTGSVAGDAAVLAFVSGTPPDFPLSV